MHATQRSGALHVTKECSEYNGTVGSFCTITSSNISAIKRGMRVVYLQTPGDGVLDSDIVLSSGHGPAAFGHVVLDLSTAQGRVTISGGNAKFRGFQADVVVSVDRERGVALGRHLQLRPRQRRRRLTARRTPQRQRPSRRRALGKGRKMRRLVLLLVVAAAAAAGGGYALASNDAQQAHGSLRSQPLVEGCTSPIGFCTVGRASGTINGDFVFTARRMVPSDTPGVILFTGEIVFQTSHGEVRCQDAGAYNSGELESGPGPFASVCTITGGTGHWAGVTGHIRTHGTFTLAEGGNSQLRGVDLALSPARRRCRGPRQPRLRVGGRGNESGCLHDSLIATVNQQQLARCGKRPQDRPRKAATAPRRTSRNFRAPPADGGALSQQKTPHLREILSPLTDSNRRPPPYHGGFGASHAYTRDHARHSFSCKSD